MADSLPTQGPGVGRTRQPQPAYTIQRSHRQCRRGLVNEAYIIPEYFPLRPARLPEREGVFTSVHSDSGSCAWGSGVCARRVEQQQHSARHSFAKRSNGLQAACGHACAEGAHLDSERPAARLAHHPSNRGGEQAHARREQPHSSSCATWSCATLSRTEWSRHWQAGSIRIRVAALGSQACSGPEHRIDRGAAAARQRRLPR